ncbi:hypothetical protein Trihar35433_10487 [Trichoderma harzianum]|nr:hypothetical protein Trihar35433_10487 [Trichoderma harzianum]
MAKTQINQFWIWILSSAAIIGVLLIAFPALHSLSAASPPSPSKSTNNDGTKKAHNTIYNPGDSVLQGARSSNERPNFLFEFLERHDIESLDSAADEAWDQAMSTPLGGFLLVKHNETYNLGWGNYFGLAAENTGHGTHTHGGRDGATLKVDERTHVEHCLGYIGRALLCNGDDTLEPPFTKKDADGNILLSAVNGQGHQHSCRDSTLAWQTVFASEEDPVEPFEWSAGDTVRSVFGKK